MGTDAVAIFGFVALFALMLLRKPVGQTSMRTVTDYTFGVIPMFMLMGTFMSNSGMSRDLFKAANGFVGHLRGGLGIATVAACGGLPATCGSTAVTAAAVSAAAHPATH